DALGRRLYWALAEQGFETEAVGDAMASVGADQRVRPAPHRQGPSGHHGPGANEEGGHAGPPLQSNGRGQVETVLTYAAREIVPNLRRTTEEISHLIRGLDGGYVPAGPSGAPTRGMAN